MLDKTTHKFQIYILVATFELILFFFCWFLFLNCSLGQQLPTELEQDECSVYLQQSSPPVNSTTGFSGMVFLLVEIRGVHGLVGIILRFFLTQPKELGKITQSC